MAKERHHLDSDRLGLLIALGPMSRQRPLEMLDPPVAGGSEMLRFTLCPQSYFDDGETGGMKGIRLLAAGPPDPPIPERGATAPWPQKPLAQDTAPSHLRGFRNPFPLLSNPTAHQNETVAAQEKPAVWL